MEYNNEQFRFGHDITHCGGLCCQLREHCLRYLAYQEIKDVEGAYYSVFNIVPKGRNHATITDCNEFIECNIKKK